MKRLGAFALVAALAAAGGCATNAKYIEKQADSGVVVVPDGAEGRREALALIEKHVGPNYEIVQEGPGSARRASRTGLPETNESLNPRNAAYPAQRAMGPNASFQSNPASQTETSEYRIAYRKTGGSAGGTNSVQTQYPPGGAAPNVQPAGGLNSSFNRNTVRPAIGGADCDH